MEYRRPCNPSIAEAIPYAREQAPLSLPPNIISGQWESSTDGALPMSPSALYAPSTLISRGSSQARMCHGRHGESCVMGVPWGHRPPSRRCARRIHAPAQSNHALSISALVVNSSALWKICAKSIIKLAESGTFVISIPVIVTRASGRPFDSRKPMKDTAAPAASAFFPASRNVSTVGDQLNLCSGLDNPSVINSDN